MAGRRGTGLVIGTGGRGRIRPLGGSTPAGSVPWLG